MPETEYQKNRHRYYDWSGDEPRRTHMYFADAGIAPVIRTVGTEIYITADNGEVIQAQLGPITVFAGDGHKLAGVDPLLTVLNAKLEQEPGLAIVLCGPERTEITLTKREGLYYLPTLAKQKPVSLGYVRWCLIG